MLSPSFYRYIKTAGCFLVAMGLLALFSCKKDKHPQPHTPTKKDLLTAHPWKAISIQANPPVDNGSGHEISDYYAELDACEQDDLTRYKTDSTFTYEEGATKCNDTDPQVYETGVWQFSADESRLIESPSSSATYIYTIVELTENHMVLTSIRTFNGTEHTFTATYIAQ